MPRRATSDERQPSATALADGREPMRVLWLLISSLLASLSSGRSPSQQPRARLRPARKVTVPVEPSREWDKCYDELGCLNTTQEWYHAVFRVHNPVPLKRRTINTRFLIHTKNGRREGEVMPATADGIEAAGFNKALPTFILIHDFTSAGSTGWIKRMSEALLCTGDRNVIAVDWGLGALPPYIQAVANTRVVALEIVTLLRVLSHSEGIMPTDVHLIGHGLGAHIAGYVGEATPGIGRITGLDPSGPQFQGMPAVVRLDPSDAIFVDVIHTDVSEVKDPNADLAQGTADVSGHVDFYPNGGSNQPGCRRRPHLKPLMQVTRESVSPGSIHPGCNHKRSFKYFIESILGTGCYFVSFECADKDSFAKGKCTHCGPRGSKCAVLGLPAPDFRPSSSGKYFVKTTNASPFCLFSYRIDVFLARPKKSKHTVEGAMALSIIGKTGPPITMSLGKNIVMKHGKDYSMMSWHGPPYVNPAIKAQLDWNYHGASLTHPSVMCVGCNTSIFVSKLLVTSLPRTPTLNETTVALCSCDGAPFAVVHSNNSHVFVPCAAAHVVNMATHAPTHAVQEAMIVLTQPISTTTGAHTHALQEAVIVLTQPSSQVGHFTGHSTSPWGHLTLTGKFISMSFLFFLFYII